MSTVSRAAIVVVSVLVALAGLQFVSVSRQPGGLFNKFNCPIDTAQVEELVQARVDWLEKVGAEPTKLTVRGRSDVGGSIPAELCTQAMFMFDDDVPIPRWRTVGVSVVTDDVPREEAFENYFAGTLNFPDRVSDTQRDNASVSAHLLDCLIVTVVWRDVSPPERSRSDWVEWVMAPIATSICSVG